MSFVNKKSDRCCSYNAYDRTRNSTYSASLKICKGFVFFRNQLHADESKSEYGLNHIENRLRLNQKSL